MISLTTEIQDIINKNLPAQIGEVLKQRLIAADQLEARLKDAVGSIESLKAENTRLSIKNAEAQDILRREAELRGSEAKLRADQARLDLEAAVLKARTEMASEMRAQHLEVVKAVFQNNQFKYTRTTDQGHAFPGVPHPGNPYPCPQTAVTQSTERVVAEGAPSQP